MKSIILNLFLLLVITGCNGEKNDNSLAVANKHLSPIYLDFNQLLIMNKSFHKPIVIEKIGKIDLINITTNLLTKYIVCNGKKGKLDLVIKNADLERVGANYRLHINLELWFTNRINNHRDVIRIKYSDILDVGNNLTVGAKFEKINLWSKKHVEYVIDFLIKEIKHKLQPWINYKKSVNTEHSITHSYNHATDTKLTSKNQWVVDDRVNILEKI